MNTADLQLDSQYATLPPASPAAVIPAAPALVRLYSDEQLAQQALAEHSAGQSAELANELALRARASLDLSHALRGLLALQPTDPSRLELYRLHSAILPDDRTVSVYLPPQYAAEPTRRFPVFYLHDGQNLFDPNTSYIPGRTWRAGSTADRVNRDHTAAPVILVGIANTGLRRMAEYTPTRDPRMGGGDGNAYGRLLVEELKPLIDRDYRTLPDAGSTALGGSSLGGLISLYLGFSQPEVFGRLAVLSPSIWWDQRSILRVVARTQPRPTLRIWLDIGTAEGARHVRDTERLDQLLRDRGWRHGVDLACLMVEGAVHDEDAWARRFDQVLQFLFPV